MPAAPHVSALDTGTLTGKFIALEPLSPAHRGELLAAAADESIWRFIPFDVSAGYGPRFDEFSAGMARGQNVTYAVRRLRDGALIGSSSYLAIAPNDGRVEIGATWYVPESQGGHTNPEAKYLLLGNAFACFYERVEFKTCSRNARSRAALAKLGATEEGTMRHHMWMPQGYWRDSVYFSILREEWPQVKARLEMRLASMA